MTIENFPIKQLTLLEGNPRKISKEQMNKLCKSIAEDPVFLYHRPILVNLRDGKYIVYAGNQRVRAAKSLKMKEIPCIIEKDLAEPLMRQRIIKDNKTYGEFDFDILANEWDIDVLIDCGFDPNELIGPIDDDKESQSDPKGKKAKDPSKCPKCGHEFIDG
jgi:ParB-like chromosome segregation protein Spo0J